MGDLMDEMEVAQFSDLALVLPRVLLDAVVDLEAPMKAAAAATHTKAGSKSANSNSIRFWSKNSSPV